MINRGRQNNSTYHCYHYTRITITESAISMWHKCLFYCLSFITFVHLSTRCTRRQCLSMQFQFHLSAVFFSPSLVSCKQVYLCFVSWSICKGLHDSGCYERPLPVHHNTVRRYKWRLRAGTAAQKSRAAAKANEELFTLCLTYTSDCAREKRLFTNKDKQIRHLNLNT